MHNVRPGICILIIVYIQNKTTDKLSLYIQKHCKPAHIYFDKYR